MNISDKTLSFIITLEGIIHITITLNQNGLLNLNNWSIQANIWWAFIRWRKKWIRIIWKTHKSMLIIGKENIMWISQFKVISSVIFLFKTVFYDIVVDMEAFLKQDWKNVEYIGFAGAKIDDIKWRLFADHADLFPSLKWLSLRNYFPFKARNQTHNKCEIRRLRKV